MSSDTALQKNVVILIRTALIVACGSAVCLLAESKVAWSVASIVGVTSLLTFLDYFTVLGSTKNVKEFLTKIADNSTSVGACTSVYSIMAAGIFFNVACVWGQ